MNKTKGSLASSKDYIDSWSGATDLPVYWDPENILAATSIIIPLASPPIGFMTLEFRRYLECTSNAKAELTRLAKTLRIILSLHEANKLQKDNTESAINTLRDHLGQERRSPLVKPQVFLAFPAHADDGVVGVIKEVLNKLAADLEVVSWDEMSQSGDINQQILEAISNATYGVCYFSELAEPDSAPYKFRDNPNVVFEAGMLQALTNSPTAKPTAWIPIREMDSPRVPFDFASQRTIVVKRGQNNRLNEQTLRHDLDKQIGEWFTY
jgi:hypothetical protein